MVAELPAQSLGLFGISSLPGVLSHESSMKPSLTPTEGGLLPFFVLRSSTHSG